MSRVVGAMSAHSFYFWLAVCFLVPTLVILLCPLPLFIVQMILVGMSVFAGTIPAIILGYDNHGEWNSRLSGKVGVTSAKYIAGLITASYLLFLAAVSMLPKMIGGQIEVGQYIFTLSVSLYLCLLVPAFSLPFSYRRSEMEERYALPYIYTTIISIIMGVNAFLIFGDWNSLFVISVTFCITSVVLYSTSWVFSTFHRVSSDE